MQGALLGWMVGCEACGVVYNTGGWVWMQWLRCQGC
jgi:hypothetical protein